MLLDTNAVIDLIDGTLPPASGHWLDAAITNNQQSISVITRIELFSKLLHPTTTQLLTSFVQLTDVLGLDEPIIQHTMRLRQQKRMKLPDAIIAATALVHGLTLVTRNVADFQNLPGLLLLNPHDPAQLPLL